MEYSYPIRIKCPMCGIVNKLYKTGQDYYRVEHKKPFIMCCDMEEGGCDRYFVAIVSLSASVKTATYQEEASEGSNTSWNSQNEEAGFGDFGPL